MPIAPGYHRCTAIVSDNVGNVGPDPAYPPHMGVTRVHYTQVSRPCNTEYHESTAAQASGGASCACGLFAVGRCTRCETSVCGNHGLPFDGRILCPDCRAAAVEAAADAEARAATRALEASLQRFDRWLDDQYVKPVSDDGLRQLLDGALLSSALCDPEKPGIWPGGWPAPMALCRHLNARYGVPALIEYVETRATQSIVIRADRAGIVELLKRLAAAHDGPYDVYEGVRTRLRGYHLKTIDRTTPWFAGTRTHVQDGGYRSSTSYVKLKRLLLPDGRLVEVGLDDRRISQAAHVVEMRLEDLRKLVDRAGLGHHFK